MPTNFNSKQTVMYPAKSKTFLSQKTKTKIFIQDIPDDVQQGVSFPDKINVFLIA